MLSVPDAIPDDFGRDTEMDSIVGKARCVDDDDDSIVFPPFPKRKHLIRISGHWRPRFGGVCVWFGWFGGADCRIVTLTRARSLYGRCLLYTSPSPRDS